MITPPSETAESRLALLGVQTDIRTSALPSTFSALLAGDGVPVCTRVAVDPTAAEGPSDLLAALTEAVVRASPLLCVHAAVVASGDAVVAIPGQSGLGKSTLTAALVRSGFSYLSDETLAIDRTTGAVAAFARPISLAPDVWPLLGLAEQAEPAESAGWERQFEPDRFGAVHRCRDWPDQAPRVRHIILAERRPGPVELHHGEHSAAVATMLTRAFNHFQQPLSSVRTVATTVRGATVWRAGYADAPDLAAALSAALR